MNVCIVYHTKQTYIHSVYAYIDAKIIRFVSVVRDIFSAEICVKCHVNIVSLCAGVVEWRSGGVEEWWSGGVVEWWSGGVVEWRRGGVVEWWSYRVVEWWSG